MAVRRPCVSTCIPGTTDLDQLDENFKAVTSGWNPDDSKILSAHMDRIRPLYCSMCGACEGQCAKGLPVSDIIRYVSYAEGYGEFALGRQNWLELAASHQAVRCGDCAECTVTCPKASAFSTASRVPRSCSRSRIEPGAHVPLRAPGHRLAPRNHGTHRGNVPESR